MKKISLAALTALLAGTACLPPVAFHDGLPAWSPPAGKPEASIGYHRMFWSEAEGSAWYLTPGFRVGLATSPSAIDVGLVSMIAGDDGEFGLLAGPALGVGSFDESSSFMFRPSAYVLAIGMDDGLQPTFWPQLEVLMGNGYRAKGVNFSAGGRASFLGIGPLALVDVNVGGVVFRGECSFMLSMPGSWAIGRSLTAGLTVAAPTGPGSTEE